MKELLMHPFSSGIPSRILGLELSEISWIWRGVKIKPRIITTHIQTDLSRVHHNLWITQLNFKLI